MDAELTRVELDAIREPDYWGNRDDLMLAAAAAQLRKALTWVHNWLFREYGMTGPAPELWNLMRVEGLEPWPEVMEDTDASSTDGCGTS